MMKRSTLSMIISIIPLSLILLLTIGSAYALRNPAAVYCDSLGYNYTTEAVDGDYQGYCLFPDKTKVDAWQFLLGEEASERSYCAKQGYLLKAASDPAACGRLFTSSCAVCVVNGTEVEVTQLMGLTFAETTCGDGHCGFPENSEACSQDCPAGGEDMHCDQAADGICDPDCAGDSRQTSDPDCDIQYRSGWLLWLVVAAVILVIAIGIVIWRRATPHKSKRKTKR